MTDAYRSVFRPGLFAATSIIVTGGGSGIGRCIAHELVSLGARVALVGRKVAKLHKVQEELGETHATVHVCDIREEPAVQQTVSEVLVAHGRVDGLVNNAGGQFPSALADISAKGFDAVVRTNLTGGFLVARECYTQSMRAMAGTVNLSIVNIIADMWNGMPGMGHSGAARAGMLNLTETASLEWAPVRVNAVAPGWIASSGLDRYPPEMAELIRGLGQHTPAQRLGTEAEVSAAVVFLLSPAAAFISGACLRVDGAGPNAKRVWPSVGNGSSPPSFEGFPHPSRPGVLGD